VRVCFDILCKCALEIRISFCVRGILHVYPAATMVFLMESAAQDPSYVISLFGVQYKDITTEKQKTVSTLLKLVEASAGHVDCLLDDQQDGNNDGCKTMIFVAYWASSSDYRSWWAKDDVQGFWGSLPDDAGVWREVMIVPESRFMHASTADKKTGMSLARMATLQQSSNEGYWGVYRNRLAASKTDDLMSPYVTSSTPKMANGAADKPILQLENPTGEPKPIRHGRVHLPKGIDNLAWAREYQSYVGMKEVEHEQWAEHLTPHAKVWMEHLDKERSKNGFLSFRISVAVESADLENGNAASLRKINEMNQFAYVLDLAHFERAGKSFEQHRKLRKNMMELMGPDWAAHLMVELAVLKASDLEAEYVGCVEGTGLMFLEEIVGAKTA
jgi:Haem-containing dehydratase